AVRSNSLRPILQIRLAHIARNDRTAARRATGGWRGWRRIGLGGGAWNGRQRFGWRRRRRGDDTFVHSRFGEGRANAALRWIGARPAAGDGLVVVVERSAAHRATARQTNETGDK